MSLSKTPLTLAIVTIIADKTAAFFWAKVPAPSQSPWGVPGPGFGPAAQPHDGAAHQLHRMGAPTRIPHQAVKTAGEQDEQPREQHRQWGSCRHSAAGTASRADPPQHDGPHGGRAQKPQVRGESRGWD